MEYLYTDQVGQVGQVWSSLERFISLRYFFSFTLDKLDAWDLNFKTYSFHCLQDANAPVAVLCSITISQAGPRWVQGLRSRILGKNLWSNFYWKICHKMLIWCKSLMLLGCCIWIVRWYTRSAHGNHRIRITRVLATENLIQTKPHHVHQKLPCWYLKLRLLHMSSESQLGIQVARRSLRWKMIK